MSNKVDTRVVRMEFDNAQFEKKVKQTTKSLDDLNQSMDFSDAGKGLDEVKVKISALEIAAIAAISNITTRVVNLGIQLVKSLSVDNIAAGWAKYGDKTTSVATMIAQKIRIAGKEIEDQAEKLEIVNEQLELLNWFSDETSYSFNDMVSNVGKFTAAGQDLDVSVKAMEGIATWAALSGQNAQTASSAMYQLAQAMSAGTVKLQDWKSIQNANMDTEEFRETILKTAVDLGQLTKEGDEYITKTGKRFKQAQFTTLLSEGWFTSDVLIKGLGKYSAAVDQIYEISERTGLTASEVIEQYGDQLDEFGIKAFKAAQEARTFTDVLNSIKDAVSSKWMQTFENIFGGQDESVQLWTELANELYDVFAESGNFRNNVLSLWGELGGRNDIFGKHGTDNQGAFWNLYDAVIAVVNTIKGAWNTIFPLSKMEEENDQASDIARNLKRITSNIKAFTERLMMSEDASRRLGKIFEIVFSVVKVGIKLLQALRYILDPIVQVIKNIIRIFAEDIIFLSNGFGSIETTIENFAVKAQTFLIRVIEFLTPIANIVHNLMLMAMVFIKNVLSKIPSLLDSIFSKNDAGDPQSVVGFVQSIFDLLKSFINGKDKIDVSAIGVLVEFCKNSLTGLVKLMQEIIPILAKLVKLLYGLITSVISVVGKVVNKVLDILNGKNLGKILAIAVALTIIATIFVTIYNLIWLISAIVAPWATLVDSITGVLDSVAQKVKAKIVATLARSLLMIAISLAIVASINTKDLIKAASVITYIFFLLYLVTRLLTQGNAKDLGKNYSKQTRAMATLMNSFSKAILSMAISLLIISKIALSKLYKSVSVITALIGIMLLSVTYLTKLNKTKTNSSGVAKVMKAMVSFAASLVLMAISIGILSKLNVGRMFSAIAALGLILTEMVGVMAIIKYAKLSPTAMLIFSQALNLLSIALLILSLDIKILGSMKIGTVLQGSAVILAFLAMVLIIQKLNKGMKAAALGVFAISLGLLATAFIGISTAIAILGSLSIKTLLQGSIAITVLLAIILLIQRLNKGMKAAALGVFAVALNLLATALTLIAGVIVILGALDIGTIFKGIAVISGLILLFEALSQVFGLKGIALLSLMSLSLLLFAGALNLLMPPLLALSLIDTLGLAKNMLVLAGGFVVLGVAGLLLKKVTGFILGFSVSLFLIGAAILFAGTGISLLVAAISSLVHIILTDGKDAIALLLVTFIEQIPILMQNLGESIGSFMTGLITGFGNILPSLIAMAKKTLTAILELIFTFLPQIIEPVIQTLDDLLAALAAHSVSIAQSVMTIILAVLQVIDENFSEIANRLFSMLHQLLVALNDWIPELVGDLVDIIMSLLEALVTELGPRIPQILKLIVIFIGQVIQGLVGVIVPLAGMLTKVILILIAVAIKLVIISLGTLGSLFIELVTATLMIIYNIIMGLMNVVFEMLKTIIVNVVILLNKALAFVGEMIPKMLVSGFSAFIGGILKGFVDILDKWKLGWVADMLGIRKASKQMLESSVSIFDDVIASGQNVTDAMNEAANSINNVVKSTTGAVTNTIGNALDNINDAVGDAAQQLGDTMGDFGEQIGGNFTDGLTDGMNGNNEDLYQAGADAADTVIEGTEEESDTHSPSRVFMKIGEYFAQGLALGIQNGQDVVMDNLTKMINSTIGLAEDIISDTEDNDITLVVGLDTSNVESQASKVEDIMSGISSPELSFYGRNAEYNAKNIKKGSGVNEIGNGSTSDNSTKVTYNNTFNISSTDPQESAEEIDEKLKEQALRARYARGM